MKWAEITRGRRARKRGIEVATLDCDEPVVADLRILDGRDHGAVLEYAAAYARRHAGEPRDGDERYEFGKDIATVQIGLVDAASPDDKPEPFFASADEVLEALDRDRISSLAAQQRFFQAVVSPFPFAFTDEEFANHVAELAFQQEGDDHPFVKWGPALQLSFTRSLARRYVSSLQLSSPTTSDSGSAGN